jgi:hypothetical protein
MTNEASCQQPASTPNRCSRCGCYPVLVHIVKVQLRQRREYRREVTNAPPFIKTKVVCLRENIVGLA